jgi:hypothetical protein
MNIYRNESQWNQWAKEKGHKSLSHYLYASYVEQRCTTRLLGQMMGLRKDRVSQLLKKHNIPRRKTGGVGR